MAGDRKTRAIMFSDMKGYSAAMSRDETNALALIALHNTIVRRVVAEHGGELVKFLGDGSLSCFESASDAVGCAVALQRELAERNATVSVEQRIVLRIGIHIGDVVLKDGDAFGDGVNVAARVEPLAAPGGICITQTVYDIVRSRPEIQTVSLGPKELKNIQDAVTIYQVVVDSQLPAAAVAHSARARRSMRWPVGIAAAVLAAGVAWIVWPRPAPPDSPAPVPSAEVAAATPLDELRRWLAARDRPLRVGLVPLSPVGEATGLAQTLDLRLDGVLRGLQGVEVVAVAMEPGASPAAVAASASGTDVVVTGAAGTLGSTRIVNLLRLDLPNGQIGARSYAEGSEDDVAAAFPTLLRDVLVNNAQGLAKELVDQTVKRYAGQLKYCYERALKTNPTLSGQIEVGWTVEPSGRTRGARVVSDTVGDEAMGVCMVHKVERWLFPAGVEGEIQWPFVFSTD